MADKLDQILFGNSNQQNVSTPNKSQSLDDILFAPQQQQGQAVGISPEVIQEAQQKLAQQQQSKQDQQQLATPSSLQQLVPEQVTQFGQRAIGELLNLTSGMRLPPQVAPKQETLAQQFGGEFVNQGLFGLPKPLLRRIGVGPDTPEGAAEKTAQIAGGIAGLVAGAPAKLAIKSAQKLGQVVGFSGTRLLPTLLRRGAAGAITGAAQTPDTETGEILLPKERGVQGLIGAGLGALSAVGEKTFINTLNKFKQIKNPIKLAKKVRQDFFNTKRDAGLKFEKDLNTLISNNPDKSISIREAVEGLAEDIKINPKLKSDIAGAMRRSKSTLLKDLIDNPEIAENLTLKQTQTIKQTINKAPGLSVKLKQGNLANWSDTDIPLLDLLDEVKSSQLDVFPELADANTSYKNVLGRYRQLKNRFKAGSLIRNMKSGFGDEEIELAVKELLPQSTIKEIGGFRKSAKLMQDLGILKKAAIKGVAIGGAGAAGFSAIKKLLGN